MLRTAMKRGPRVRLSFVGDDGLTKQSMKDECDINLIMAKFVKTGAVEHAIKFSGEYGFATSVDFKDAMDIVARGESMFEELPAAIRNRFENDTGRFLDFVQDPANADEMLELGLREPPTPEEALPAPAEEVPPVGPPEAPAAAAAAEASD